MSSIQEHDPVPPRPSIVRPRSAPARAGITLIELLVVMAVMTVAMGIYSSTVAATSRQRTVHRETLLAAEAARVTLERMRNQGFRDLARLYDPDPRNDPAGPGTAPGNRFAVEGLTPLPEAPDGMVGEVVLPSASPEPGVWQLREDVLDPGLGMPRDLDGDNIVDPLDHAADFIRLPVRVRVDWLGRFGPRRYEMATMLVEARP